MKYDLSYTRFKSRKNKQTSPKGMENVIWKDLVTVKVKKLENANESIVEVDTATLERLLCMICAKRKALVGLKYELYRME